APDWLRSLRETIAYYDLWLAPYDLVYLGLLAVTYLTFLRVRRLGHQPRFLDYRALAEGLRVQFYWRLSGLTDSAADHYLRRQKGELDWIRAALRAGDILDGVAVPAPPSPP